MAVVTIEQLENLAVDSKSVEDFVNGAADINGTGLVPTRIGPDHKTLAKIVSDAEILISTIEEDAQESAAGAALSAITAEGAAAVATTASEEAEGFSLTAQSWAEAVEGGIPQFDTADLMILASLSEGFAYKTKGRSVLGDGGDSWYLIQDRLEYLAENDNVWPDGFENFLVNSSAHVAVNQRAGGKINVKHFGPTGTTDDAPTINKAADALRASVARVESDSIGTGVNQAYFSILYFPAVPYILATPINLTGIQTSHSYWTVGAEGAIFFLRTGSGETGFDLIGSRKCAWEGGTIIGEEQSLCRSGMQVGRDSSLGAADSHHFKNLQIIGHFELACWHNFASEDCYLDGVHFKNNHTAWSYCMVQDGDNYHGIASQYATVVSEAVACSFLRNYAVRLDARRTGPGCAVFITGSKAHTFHDSYLVADDRAAVEWFIGVSGQERNNMLTLDLHVETDAGDTDQDTGIDNFIWFNSDDADTDVLVRDLVMRESTNHSQESVFARSANIELVSFTNANLTVGRVGREVGQTLFDVPSKFLFQGTLTSQDDTNSYDIVGMSRFVGTFVCNDVSTHGQDDNLDVTLVDITGSYSRGKTFGMADSTGQYELTLVDGLKNQIAVLRNTGMWNFIIGAISYVKISTVSFYPSTDNFLTLWRLLQRFKDGFITNLYLGAGNSKYTVVEVGTPETAEVANPGSFCTSSISGGAFKKVTGTSNTGWEELAGVNYVDSAIAAIPSQGEFVPSISVVSPGDLSIVYGTRIASYIRQGKFIHFNIYLNFTPTFTTAGGALELGPLPFVNTINGGPKYFSIEKLNQRFDWDHSATVSGVCAKLNVVADTMTFEWKYNTGFNVEVEASHLSSGLAHIVGFSGTYLID